MIPHASSTQTPKASSGGAPKNRRRAAPRVAAVDGTATKNAPLAADP